LVQFAQRDLVWEEGCGAVAQNPRQKRRLCEHSLLSE